MEIKEKKPAPDIQITFTLYNYKQEIVSNTFKGFLPVDIRIYVLASLVSAAGRCMNFLLA